LKGFLFDENVPSRLTISASFRVVHRLELGQSLSDTFLWEHARSNNMRRREFHAFLVRIWPEVESLLPAHKLINVYEDRIEAVG
jgi:hypothetical protein